MPTSNDSKGRPEFSRRRSQRVILNVAVKVRSETSGGGAAFEEETRTLAVNEHGAMITLASKVEEGQTLRLTNQTTHAEEPCKVTYLGAKWEGKIQVGLAFLQPNPNFWLITFREDIWAGLPPELATYKKK
jgi:hypothetical protein